MGFVELPEAINPAEMLRDLEKQRCERSLSYFIKRAWHAIEPGQPYVHNWHIDLICEHLEAITNDEYVGAESYNRLLINVPPGMMKSLMVGVFWPAWEWGPKNLPHLRYICASHQQGLAIRDSVKMRRLVSSEWYQRHWGDHVKLANDQNAKTKFENDATGFREATAAGSITGVRGDRVIIDDPHSVEGAASDAMRQTTLDWFLEAVPTRLNNPKTSAIVVIMQRLHEEDVSGVILEKSLGYDHIMLPMRYDPGRAFTTRLGTSDPREIDGELLFPERFPLAVVERDEAIMGPWATAGQMQQSPEPRGGGIIKREWWRTWEEEAFPPMDFILASLDTAYTEKQENDFSALTIWGIFTALKPDSAMSTQSLPRVGSLPLRFERAYTNTESIPAAMMMFAWQKRLPFNELLIEVAKDCKRFKVDRLIIENKANGISLEQEFHRSFPNREFAVQLINPGALDKLARLYSIQHLFAGERDKGGNFRNGQIWAPDRSWSDTVINQIATFPKGKHDDLVDSTSQALRHLRDCGMLTRAPERLAEIEESKVYRGKPPAPLYPG